MAFNINKINLEVKPIKIVFDDGNELNFHYKPAAYTPEHEDKVDVARADNKSGSTLKAWLIPLLVDWDVVNERPKIGEDGEPVLKNGKLVIEIIPVPITEEGMGCIPLVILGKMMAKIAEDMVPGEAKSTDLGGSFS